MPTGTSYDVYTQPPDLTHAEITAPLLPSIERLLADAELAAESC